MKQMNKKNDRRGGQREGAGRKRLFRDKPLGIRISKEAMAMLTEMTTNKSKFIDGLIKKEYNGNHI